MKRNPKTIVMVNVHKTSNTTSVSSYHGTVSMLDNQKCFDTTFINPMELYKLASNQKGGVAFERDMDNGIVK